MNSISSHIRIVAWLHIFLGCIGLLEAVVVALVLGAIGAVIGGAIGHAIGAIVGVLGVGGIVFVMVGIFALPNLLVGWGLLKGFEWARVVGIIVSIISLFHPSFGLGTAIAIYSLIILFSSELETLFRRS